jgi:AcrR family transcriptional regulator
VADASAAPPVEAPVRLKLRERLRRETAAEIIVAAEEIFADSGLAKAHVEDIARRAGVAVGTLYNYYKDRDALLAATLTLRIQEMNAEMTAVALAHARRDVKDQLRALAQAYVAFFRKRRTFVRILKEGELAQLTEAYPTAAAIPTQCWQAIRELFARVMQRAVASGKLPAAHADVDLWLFMGLLHGVVTRDLRGFGECREEDVDRLVNVFFEGVLR